MDASPFTRRNILKASAVTGAAALGAGPLLLGAGRAEAATSTRASLAARTTAARGTGHAGDADFAVDPYWPKPIPRDPSTGRYWVTGEVAGTDCAPNGHLFTCNRSPTTLTATETRNFTPSPVFIEYDEHGNIVNTATPEVVPNSVHGVTVDYQGYVWMGGNNDAIVQKYTHDLKHLVLQIGTPGLFDTNDGTAAGKPLNSSHTRLNKPASIAVDPANGDVYIADGYGNSRVVVFDKHGSYLRQWGSQGTAEDALAGAHYKFYGVVHDVKLGNDGLVYVCNRHGNRVQIFEKDGTYVRSIWINGTYEITNKDAIGTAWWMVFSRDYAQQTMYVSDGEESLIWVIDRASGQAVGKYGAPGHMAGELTYNHTMALDPSGRSLYVAETVGGRRLQKFTV